MSTLNIATSFITSNKSVFGYFSEQGQGLYIPMYQREYSWDTDNIDQLLEDLTKGIQRIASGEIQDDSKEIRFLGTIITVYATGAELHLDDPEGKPTRTDKLIDGQQRVSTIALMATLLVKHLLAIKAKVKVGNPIYEQVQQICNALINKKLMLVFSFDLGRGTPSYKPKIIRGSVDYWTSDRADDVAYHSELSNYLARVIRAIIDNNPLPGLQKDEDGKPTLLYQNARKIDGWIKNTVMMAHDPSFDGDFSSAEHIIEHFSQDQIWSFDRPQLVDCIKEKNPDKKSNSYILCELVQVISVCHYLLDRCCFTVIQPTDEDWAFDMIQSLNATGTPLTAIETFKPMVVTEVETTGSKFSESKSGRYLKKVEDYLSAAKTAQLKNKLTNDYLTSFFTSTNGSNVSTHFSYQRRALQNLFSAQNTFEGKEHFIVRMGNYAEFYKQWTEYEGPYSFPEIDHSAEANLAALLILFLKKSNHKMAITVLGRFYEDVIEKKEDAVQHFVDAVKVVAAYYFLWRATHPNTGLDSSYRNYFEELSRGTITLFSVETLREYFTKRIEEKQVGKKDLWVAKAKEYFKYDNHGRDILRLALLISAHETIVDGHNKGLMKVGRSGGQQYLTLEKWLSEDLKTIEHVAPQTNESRWDDGLYDSPINTFQSIGNLTLLPQDLNSSVGNRPWAEKLLYYKCVSETDPDVLQSIETEAQKQNVDLKEDTINMLRECGFNQHILPISTMDYSDKWDKALVERRTERMLGIIWDRISPWVIVEDDAT